MLLPDQESHRFANLMDKMESELNRNKRERERDKDREREISIEWNTCRESIGRFDKVILCILYNCF